DEQVRLTLLETRQLESHVEKLLSTTEEGLEKAPKELAAQLVTHHLAAQRNKRCLLAYHSQRIDMVQRKLWSKGGSIGILLDSEEVLTEGGGEGEERSKLNPNEMEHLKNYSQLLTAYKSEFLDLFDITSRLDPNSTGPPTQLMVTVIAKREANHVQTESGSLNLRKGERLRVQRSEVESLILRDWVEVVED
ncbi:hypothetical protein IE53DRAFT_391085, partial [Violaceomyces palustris]